MFNVCLRLCLCAHAFSYWTILENVIDGARVHTHSKHIRILLWGNGRFIETYSLLLLSANFRPLKRE